jgi:glycosyltransferase involved in cell wall biosynthesis
VPLSVLVPVKNEAVNPSDCLASVSFAQEVVVVDSASTDGTEAVAEAAGTRRARKRWLKKLAKRAPFRPSLRFVYHYI